MVRTIFNHQDPMMAAGKLRKERIHDWLDRICAEIFNVRDMQALDTIHHVLYSDLNDDLRYGALEIHEHQRLVRKLNDDYQDMKARLSKKQ